MREGVGFGFTELEGWVGRFHVSGFRSMSEGGEHAKFGRATFIFPIVLIILIHNTDYAPPRTMLGQSTQRNA